MDYATDETAVIVAVPDADPIVGRWRARFDSSARFGVPAHITIGYPFVPFPALGAHDLRDLRSLFGRYPAVDVHFRDFATFPGVLYLAPEPAEPFRELTRALVRRWPDAPPYGGRFGDEVIPHLTVSDGASQPDADAILDNVRRDLPLTTSVRTAQLIRFTGEKWVTEQELPFAS